MHADHLGEKPTNYSPQAKWKHCHFHSFISCLWLLSLYNSKGEYSWQGRTAHKAEKNCSLSFYRKCLPIPEDNVNFKMITYSLCFFSCKETQSNILVNVNNCREACYTHSSLLSLISLYTFFFLLYILFYLNVGTLVGYTLLF